MVEEEITSLFLQGREIKPYNILHSGKIVIIPYVSKNREVSLMPEKEINRAYPHAHDYLTQAKGYLENREKGRMKGEKWHAYIYPKNIDVMKSPKILIPDIADRASFTWDDRGVYAFTSGYAITLKKDTEIRYEYL